MGIAQKVISIIMFKLGRLQRYWRDESYILQLNVTMEEGGIHIKIRIDGIFRESAIELFGEKYENMESELTDELYNAVEKFSDRINESEVEK